MQFEKKKMRTHPNWKHYARLIILYGGICRSKRGVREKFYFSVQKGSFRGPCAMRDTIYLWTHKIRFVKQPNESWWRFFFHLQKYKDNEKNLPMLACAECAGWHGKILFAKALSPVSTDNGVGNCFIYVSILFFGSNWKVKAILM